MGPCPPWPQACTRAAVHPPALCSLSPCVSATLTQPAFFSASAWVSTTPRWGLAWCFFLWIFFFFPGPFLTKTSSSLLASYVISLSLSLCLFLCLDFSASFAPPAGLCLCLCAAAVLCPFTMAA